MEAKFIGAYLAAKKSSWWWRNWISSSNFANLFDSGAAIEHYEEWILHRWSHQVKRDMEFLLYDNCSSSTIRSKPFVQIQGRFEISPCLCLSDHWSSQWSHLPEYFSGVTKENDTTFFTCKNIFLPIEILYPLNLCRSFQGWSSTHPWQRCQFVSTENEPKGCRRPASG